VCLQVFQNLNDYRATVEEKERKKEEEEEEKRN
jgi:hypothetical protein